MRIIKYSENIFFICIGAFQCIIMGQVTDTSVHSYPADQGTLHFLSAAPLKVID